MNPLPLYFALSKAYTKRIHISLTRAIRPPGRFLGGLRNATGRFILSPIFVGA